MLRQGPKIWRTTIQQSWHTWWLMLDDRVVMVLRRLLFGSGRRSAIVRLLLAAGIGLVIGSSMAFLATRSMLLIGTIIILLPFLAMLVRHFRLLFVVLLPAIVSFPVGKSLMRASLEWTGLGVLAGFYFSLMLVALVVLYTLWASQLLSRRGELAQTMPILMVPHFLYVVVSLVSIVSARRPMFTLSEWFLNLQAFLLYTYMISTIRNKREVHWMIIVLLVNLILHGLVSTAVRGLGRTIGFGPVQFFIDDEGRVGGLFSHPNHATTFFYLMLPVALATLITHRNRTIKILAAVAFGAGFLGMALTQSRGGFIATCLSLFVFFVVAVWRKWMSIKIPLIVSFVGLLGFLPIAPIILQRFLEDDGGSAESRGPLAQLAWRMVLDHPVIGVGANNFPVNMFDYITPDLGEVHLFTVHNKFLLVWSETGTLGLIAFVLILLTTLYHGWVCVNAPGNQSPFYPLVGWSFACSFIGMAFHMYVNVFRTAYLIHIIWFVAGMTAILAYISTTQTDEDYGQIVKAPEACAVPRPVARPGMATPFQQGAAQQEVRQ